ncbi:unnamed protein product [Haemonchus placei]|uniref:Zinc-hook domain-containing protein n=1 Tax=Haemonchus placei TaxID=6290 RepID=A0A0N4WEN3_HAEPC|nr:unnamed protein product [Haemonchus placei]
MLYESWSEEVTKRSCCPLCERRFTSKTGAIELSGKLLDMSLAVPDDIERLERLVQETEEKERHLGNALIHVEQCKKIMDGKVKLVRKEVGDRNKEEASLTEELESLRKEHTDLNSSFKRLLEVKADVSLMDSLLASFQSLTDQINELSEGLKEGSSHISLPVLRKEVAEKELHELRERRISSCEAAARVEHIREMVARHHAEIAELNHRRDEIMERHLPKAEMELQKAKEERDTAESCAKNQEDLKLALIRELPDYWLEKLPAERPMGCRAGLDDVHAKAGHVMAALLVLASTNSTQARGPTFLSLGSSVKKCDHFVGGRPGVRLMPRGMQSVTVLVQRSSLHRITCLVHLIFDYLAYSTASLFFVR